MNDKYKDIALECSVKYIASPEWVFTDAEFKQFVELIVKQCIDQCAYMPNSNDEWDKGVRWAANQIAEHFGVEEQQDEIEFCPTCGEEWSGTSCGLNNCGWINGGKE